jgi:hypothetical protein
MLKALQWLSIEQRLFFNLCCLLWKVVNGAAPKYLENIFQSVSAVHSHGTRSASHNNLHVTGSHGNSLRLNGTQAWNKLPGALRDIKNFKTFKAQLLLHIKLNLPYGTQQ